MPAQSSAHPIITNKNEGPDGSGTSPHEDLPAELIVGMKVRELRNQHGFSLRTLAERSGLNINTLSLIENGKSSPSVGTLQQLARALEVPITAFFESEPVSKQVVFTRHDRRPSAAFSQTLMQNLGKDLAGDAVQPFVVTLEPGAGSGERMILHTGHEFVYCLSGCILYTIDQVEYSLEPGDSVVFESHLPHQWKNNAETQSQILLILYPADLRDELGGRHFINGT
jgi:transcriptional regulator with XRE-family HTH domain